MSRILTVSILVLIGCVGLYMLFTYQVSNTHHILSAEETASVLRADADGYVRSLSRVDLHARNVRSHQEYINVSANAACDVSDELTSIIYASIRKVDGFLATDPQISISSSKLQNIPWKIAVTRGRKYENGYPHTRFDIIFIDESIIHNHDFVATLLHEKVHIYQRLYSREMEAWLAAEGYKRSAHRSSFPLARANPDLDEWIYIDPYTKKEMVALYNSQQPQSISDTQLSDHTFEHPYERLAYQIGGMIHPIP